MKEGLPNYSPNRGKRLTCLLLHKCMHLKLPMCAISGTNAQKKNDHSQESIYRNNESMGKILLQNKKGLHIETLKQGVKLTLCNNSMNTFKHKTLGRARDPRANGAWLSKLTK